MSETETPYTCLGGPMCGLQIPRRFAAAWTFMIPDRQRSALHRYERTSPNEKTFRYRDSAPLLRPATQSPLEF